MNLDKFPDIERHIENVEDTEAALEASEQRATQLEVERGQADNHARKWAKRAREVEDDAADTGTVAKAAVERVRKLREALSFYAYDGNWDPAEEIKTGLVYSSVEHDNGRVARAALAEEDA